MLLILISVPLTVIALIHAFWGVGIWVPARNEEALARAAVGAQGVTRMPGPIPCFLVAAGLFAVVVALWLPHGPIRSLVLWPAALVFLGRGMIAYSRFWRTMTPVEPFATYDLWYYGPLSLALGAGLLFIQLKGA
ncbi:DUF3995 domain-containing protein [Yoonia sp.]|uniref:DUF3995 domain-containing protein n=1 Tax=Yoonia sp. TaxID=2212373 RepID=UPI003F6AAC1F